MARSWLHCFSRESRLYIKQEWCNQSLLDSNECNVSWDLACLLLCDANLYLLKFHATSSVTTWGQHWLKKITTRGWFYQVILFVDTLIKVTGKDRQFHCWDIWNFANIHVRPLCYLSWKNKQFHCLYRKHPCDFEKYTQNPNGWMQNNKHSLISQFSESPLKLSSCLGTCFKEQACLSKSSSVNKQNKRDDGWLLNPHLISANVQLFKVSCASLICFKAEEK